MFIVPLSSNITPLQSISKTGNAAAAQTAQADAGSSFKSILDDAIEAQNIAKQDGYDLAMNNTEDIATVMINSLRATTALQTVTQLTSRAISSYKEIMQMQI